MADSIISLQEARERGLQFYFTGKPCKNGHAAQRRTNGCGCVECAKITHKKHRTSPKYKAKIYEAGKRWRQQNRDKYREWQRRYRQGKRTPRVSKIFSPDEYRLRQDGKWVRFYHKNLEKKAGRPKPDHCECCGHKTQKLCFDHDHKTGEFRGWLCYPCNTALGLLKDSRERLKLLDRYLEKQHGAHHGRRKKSAEVESIRSSQPTQIPLRYTGSGG